MPSYVVTGANRGLGLAFIKNLSQNPQNIIVGLVRDKAAADKKLAKEGLKNVTIFQADVTDSAALKQAAKQVSQLTGGTLNYLINNAAYNPQEIQFKSMVDYATEPEFTELETEIPRFISINVTGVLRTINAFIPLLLATPPSSPRTVLALSTGLGDLDMTNEVSLDVSVPYSISKAALNMLIAKFQAAYKKQGIFFLCVSPGVVKTSEDEVEPPPTMVQAFMNYAPDFKGPIMPDESAELVLKVMESKSLEKGDGGRMYSHKGNLRWL